MALSVNNTVLGNVKVDGVNMNRVYVDGILVFDNSPIGISSRGTKTWSTASPYSFLISGAIGNYTIVCFWSSGSISSQSVKMGSVFLDDISTAANSSMKVFGGFPDSNTAELSYTSGTNMFCTYQVLTNTDGITSSVTTATSSNNLVSATSTKNGSFFLNIGRANNRGDQCAESPVNLIVPSSSGGCVTDGSYTAKFGYIENMADGATTGPTNPGALFDDMNGYMFLRK